MRKLLRMGAGSDDDTATGVGAEASQMVEEQEAEGARVEEEAQRTEMVTTYMEKTKSSEPTARRHLNDAEWNLKQALTTSFLRERIRNVEETNILIMTELGRELWPGGDQSKESKITVLDGKVRELEGKVRELESAQGGGGGGIRKRSRKMKIKPIKRRKSKRRKSTRRKSKR